MDDWLCERSRWSKYHVLIGFPRGQDGEPDGEPDNKKLEQQKKLNKWLSTLLSFWAVSGKLSEIPVLTRKLMASENEIFAPG